MIRRSYDCCARSACFVVLFSASAAPLAALRLGSHASGSQSTASITPATPGASKTKPEVPSLDFVQVTEVERWDKTKDADHPNTVAAGLQQIIVIRVDSLGNLVKRSECQSEQGVLVEGCTRHPIALFL